MQSFPNILGEKSKFPNRSWMLRRTPFSFQIIMKVAKLPQQPWGKIENSPAYINTQEDATLFLENHKSHKTSMGKKISPKPWGKISVPQLVQNTQEDNFLFSECCKTSPTPIGEKLGQHWIFCAKNYSNIAKACLYSIQVSNLLKTIILKRYPWDSRRKHL